MSQEVSGRGGCLVFLIVAFAANAIATFRVFLGDYGIGERIVCAVALFFILTWIIGLAKMK